MVAYVEGLLGALRTTGSHRQRLALALGACAIILAIAWLVLRADVPPNNSADAAGLERSASPPAPPPLLLRPIPPSRALVLNRSIPFSREPNPPAEQFRYAGDERAYERALGCLADAVYYEAASEPVPGQQAVAQVILNRVRHPAFAATICDVVYQGSTRPTGCQFSFTCDGSLHRTRSTREWSVAQAVAKQALDGFVYAPVGYATHYHADFVVPYWNTSLAKNAVVGRHIFYRWAGTWGRANAFTQAYGRQEPAPTMLRAIALAAREQRGRGAVLPLEKGEVEASADPVVELLSVVAMLASESWPADAKSPYGKALQSQFSTFAQHPAVEIYKQLAAEDEQLGAKVLRQVLAATKEQNGGASLPSLSLPGRDAATITRFSDALADFREKTRFDEFFRAQEEHYRSSASQDHELTADAVARFQAYTGVRPDPVRILVAPLLPKSWTSDCSEVSKPGLLVLPAILSNPAADTRRIPAAQQFLALLLTRRMFGPADCEEGYPPSARCARVPPADRKAREQITTAIAARVLPKNPKARRSAAAPDQQAAATAEALTVYEENRRWFGSLSSFYPVMLQSILDAEWPAEAKAKSRRPRIRQAAARTQPAAPETFRCV